MKKIIFLIAVFTLAAGICVSSALNKNESFSTLVYLLPGETTILNLKFDKSLYSVVSTINDGSFQFETKGNTVRIKALKQGAGSLFVKEPIDDLFQTEIRIIVASK